jgi:branched-chain amino acid transport system permease protein
MKGMITAKIVVEQVINGLALGCMYAAIASGLTLIWGTMKMLNFAHGEFYMIAGYILFFVTTSLGVHPFLAIALAVIVAFLLGIFVERAVIQPLLNKPRWDITPIVATLGISIFLQNFALNVWGEHFQNVPYFVEGSLEFMGFRMAYQRIFIFTITAIVMLGFWIYIKKAKFGLGLRATAQDRDAAAIQGISAKRVYTITFGLSCAMAGLAGVLLAPIFSVNPWMGASPVLKGFITVVLGGLGSFEGAILAGILLGTVESIAVVLLSSEWKDVVSFAIFILVLVVKPSGLFGTKEW